MKKVLIPIVALATMSLVLSITSCSKVNTTENGNNNTQMKNKDIQSTSNISELKNDSLLSELVSSWMKVKPSKINKALIDSATIDGIISDNEMYSIAINFGFISSDEYKGYLQQISGLINALEIKYSISQQPKEIIEPIISDIVSSIVFAQGSGGSSCASSFAFCAASVTAAAITGHIACAGADLFPPIGILCHASVIALQFAGNQECSNSYNSCMQSQNSPYSQYQTDMYIIGCF